MVTIHCYYYGSKNTQISFSTWSRWKGCTGRHCSDIRPNKINYLILIPTHTKLTVWVNIFVQQRSHKQWRRRKILLPRWATVLNRRERRRRPVWPVHSGLVLFRLLITHYRKYIADKIILLRFVCAYNYIWQVFFKTNRVRWLPLLWH